MREITNAAARKMGRKPASTDEFVGACVLWLSRRTFILIEENTLDKRFKVTQGGDKYTTGNTLPIALANAVINCEALPTE